ncbi:hypothetical protein L7F22_007292 [Adiantum nelumboides]|nr:hypothetical protein [Adiantum nelumboides]
MFDWEDAPLDPNNLPDVSQCDWKPQSSAVGADDILFTWIGNHYDHLDYDTVKAILNPPSPSKSPRTFCVRSAWPPSSTRWASRRRISPSSIGGIPTAQLSRLCSVQVTCVPAQHFSGRGLLDRNKTLWAGFTFECEGKKFYFAGDRKQQAFKEIGDLLGPFDLSAIPIGAYLPRSFMSTIHMAPRTASVRTRKSRARRALAYTGAPSASHQKMSTSRLSISRRKPSVLGWQRTSSSS